MGRFFIDHSGCTIGELKLGDFVVGKGYHTTCSCGHVKYRQVPYLLTAQKRGQFIACKRCVTEHSRNSTYLGKQFGQLKIERFVKQENGRPMCEIKCLCGRTEIRPLNSVLSAQRLGKFVACKDCVIHYKREIGTRSNALDLRGRKFGYYLVIGVDHHVVDKHDNNKGVWWKVKCDCGQIDVKRGYRLTEAEESGGFIGCRACYLKYVEAESRKNELNRVVNLDEDIINGLLLGDGCMTSNTEYNAILSISQTDKGLTTFLRDTIAPSHSIYTYEKSKVLDNRKDVHSCSITHSSFLPIYKRWYPNGIKVVPSDIVLNPKTVLHWFMGDGSTAWGKHGNVMLVLSTNSFSERDVKMLADKLSIVLGHRANVSTQKPWHKYPDGSEKPPEKMDKLYWRIANGGTAFIKAFFNYIGECPVPEMAYKWKIPTSQSLQEIRYQRNPYSGFFGVRPVHQRRHNWRGWVVSVKVPGQKMINNAFKHAEDAAKWRDKEILARGLQNRYPLNFPDLKKS